jgi:hypothetical protein
MVINKKHGYSTVAQIATFCIYGLSAVMCTGTWASSHSQTGDQSFLGPRLRPVGRN